MGYEVLADALAIAGARRRRRPLRPDAASCARSAAFSAISASGKAAGFDIGGTEPTASEYFK
jgi:hypothetical protein